MVPHTLEKFPPPSRALQLCILGSAGPSAGPGSTQWVPPGGGGGCPLSSPSYSRPGSNVIHSYMSVSLAIKNVMQCDLYCITFIEFDKSHPPASGASNPHRLMPWTCSSEHWAADPVPTPKNTPKKLTTHRHPHSLSTPYYSRPTATVRIGFPHSPPRHHPNHVHCGPPEKANPHSSTATK